jgi:hypothetical protein
LLLLFWSVVTLSPESVRALATAINEGSHSSSIAPTPDEVFAAPPVENVMIEGERVEGLVIEGSAMRLPDQTRKLANNDCKRYGKLFKIHGENRNTGYRITLTNMLVIIYKQSGGDDERVASYEYKVGVLKALYCRLHLFDWNMDTLIANRNDFEPFNDSDYSTVSTTPDPHEDFQGSKFKRVGGKWVDKKY